MRQGNFIFRIILIKRNIVFTAINFIQSCVYISVDYYIILLYNLYRFEVIKYKTKIFFRRL